MSLPPAQLQHALDHARQERDCEPRPDLAEYWRRRVEQLEDDERALPPPVRLWPVGNPDDEE